MALFNVTALFDVLPPLFQRYWITHEDKAYNQLMEDVSEFINDPKVRKLFQA